MSEEMYHDAPPSCAVAITTAERRGTLVMFGPKAGRESCLLTHFGFTSFSPTGTESLGAVFIYAVVLFMAYPCAPCGRLKR